MRAGRWFRRGAADGAPLRFDVSAEELERIAEQRRRPLGTVGFLKMLARSRWMAPEAARVAARGARDALVGGVFWSLVDAERARIAVPDAASGVGWCPPEELLARLLPMLGADDDVLELGAGAGRVSRSVVGHVRSLTCTDVSRPLLYEARRNLTGFANVRFHWSNGFTLAGLADASFDAAFGAGVFGFLEARQTLALYDEIRRVLRPGGALVFNQALFEGREEIERMLSSARAGGPRAWVAGCEERPYCLAQIRAWLEAAGFELEAPGPGEPPPPAGARAVIVARAR
jgi:SAM-dependent methyltransferase